MVKNKYIYILLDHFESSKNCISISDGSNYGIYVEFIEEDGMVSFNLPDHIFTTLEEAKLIANKILDWCNGYQDKLD